MRKHFVFLVALILLIALGAQSGARQAVRPNDPQYRRNEPQNRGLETRPGDRRTFIGQLSVELVRQAEYLSQSSYEYFMGWNGSINDIEQAVLFKSEEFAASCRLFNKFVLDRTDYFRRESLRTNLYNASRYVALQFHQLEIQMSQGGFQGDFNRIRRDGRSFERRLPQPQPRAAGPWGLAECRRIIDRIELEFSSWRY
jgi:hypothetical protein